MCGGGEGGGEYKIQVFGTEKCFNNIFILFFYNQYSTGVDAGFLEGGFKLIKMWVCFQHFT